MNDRGQELLFQACEQGRSKSLQEIIMNYTGFSHSIVNCLNNDLKTPLYVAITSQRFFEFINRYLQI